MPSAEQAYFGAKAERTVHIGDRFTRTGNDRMAREVANTVWVANPRETERYVRCVSARQPAVWRSTADVTALRVCCCSLVLDDGARGKE